MSSLSVKEALTAANRAAAKVLSDARRYNRPLPIWEGDEVEYRLPEQQQIDALIERAEQQNYSNHGK